MAEGLAESFEEHRVRLGAVAYRLLGSLAEAENAVQETWLRTNRADAGDIGNPGGWLTTVISRVCLNMLRSRALRRSEPFGEFSAEHFGVGWSPADPEQETVLAESIGLALLVVLDTLAPVERVAFVLHDMFAVPFEEIATMIERTPISARELASRARRRVRGAEPPPGTDLARQRKVVDAYLTAARDGDFDALVTVLDPEVVLRADPAVGPTPHPVLLRGAEAVGRSAVLAAERARFSAPALVDGSVGLVVARGGRLWLVLSFAFTDGRIAGIDLIAEPDRLRVLELAVPDA